MTVVLGIESSCDETAVAVVTDAGDVLAHRLHSQREHESTGGVVPEIAARAHLNHIDTLVTGAMQDAGLGFADLDAVAVTAGPGLIGGVYVGAMTAKAIAAVHGTPLVAVNHLEAHALTVSLTEDVGFPYLLLLVSGGHSQLLVVRGVGDYAQLGATMDDAAGECFDKTAKILGLSYPGGPALERAALQCADPDAARARFVLPRPMVGRAGCDFSFSGLKTAARRAVENLSGAADVADFCFAFQDTMAAILADRTARALDIYMEMRPADPVLVVAGGVAANAAVRAALQRTAAEKGARFVAPPPALCTDNGVMIAWAGVERLRLGLTDRPDFDVRPRWPLDPHAEMRAAKSQKI